MEHIDINRDCCAWESRSQKRSRSPVYQPDRLTIFGTAPKCIGGLSHVRVLQPMRALSAVSGVACYISESGAAVLSPARGQTWSEIGPKIMILHRPIVAGREGYETLRNLLVRDFVIITEYDDHPDYVPLPAQIRAEDLLSFTGVHAIQTSTEPLAHVLRSRNPEVAVFRNSIEQAQVAHNFTNYGQLTLFYGCFNRQQDWCELVPTLNAALRARVPGL